MVLKREDTEQLSIQWELGIFDDAYIAGQVTFEDKKGTQHPDTFDLSDWHVSE